VLQTAVKLHILLLNSFHSCQGGTHFEIWSTGLYVRQHLPVSCTS